MKQQVDPGSLPAPAPQARGVLGLFDAVCIIIGIVVGAGIYETPPRVFQNVSGPWQGLGAWALAGLLSLMGALCYAELASTYPRSGGDYVYLTRAYGAWLGFLFGWAQFAVILTGSIGMMAYVFADYAVKLGNIAAESAFVLAVLAVILLSLLNILGIVLGKSAQNVLTVAKVLGLGGILVIGLCWGRPPHVAAAAPAGDQGSLGLAMILVLYTYGGWNDAAFVAAEVRHGRRNIPLTLILGTLAITLIYVSINGAYLWSLGFDGVRQSDTVAADVLGKAFGEKGTQVMCVLVMISTLGALNGLIFTGARVYSSLGADHRLFAWLGRWHPHWGTPLAALLAQALVSLAMILVVGTLPGQGAVNRLLGQFGLNPVAWEGRRAFDTLLVCTAPVFWLFFLLTGLALFVLRIRDRGIERPFRVPLFPVVPLIFCVTCAWMLYAGLMYAGKLALAGAVLLAAGLPLYWLSKRRTSVPLPAEHPAAESLQERAVGGR